MERGSRKSSRRAPGRVTAAPLGAIEALIADGGSITIGDINGLGCVAAAADPHQCYAMLRRREGEGLQALLTRLDLAIVRAVENESVVDEVNPPGGFPAKKR